MGARAGRDGLARSDRFPGIRGKSEAPLDFGFEETALSLPRCARTSHLSRDRGADVRVLAALDQLSSEVESCIGEADTLLVRAHHLLPR